MTIQQKLLSDRVEPPGGPKLEIKLVAGQSVTKKDGTPQNVFKFVASTDTEDRMDDIVDQSNWKLGNFKNNPVITWSHRYDLPPVGKALDVGVVDNQLEIDVEIDDNQLNPLGQLVAHQLRNGILNAGSVGFRPGSRMWRSDLPEDDSRRKESGWGQVLSDNELLEFAITPIPANPEALAAKSLEVGGDSGAVMRFFFGPTSGDLMNVLPSTAEPADPKKALLALLDDSDVRVKMQLLTWGDADEKTDDETPDSPDDDPVTLPANSEQSFAEWFNDGLDT